MAIKVSSFDEVSRRIAGNALRSYPTSRKGRERLFPVPRPRLNCREALPKTASFFVIGSCFARSVEWALECAGRRVLSSRTGLGMPGSLEEQFNRYNTANVDVALNEIKWCAGIHSASPDAPLVPLGNEVVDLQLHWSFAHSEKQAKQFRKIYRESFRPALTADALIILAGGTRQWFDSEHETYINGMPPSALSAAHPGRFLLHEFDVAACADRLREAVTTIQNNSLAKPSFFLAVSPGWEILSLSGDDALVDQVRGRSIQRAAIEEVCQDLPCTTYLPALDAALLGDNVHTYLERSPSHATQNLADRIVSALLIDTGTGDEEGARMLAARARAQVALACDLAEEAVRECRAFLETDSTADADFCQLYQRALLKTGGHEELAEFSLFLLESGNSAVPNRDWQYCTAARGSRSPELMERLNAMAKKYGFDSADVVKSRSSQSAADKSVSKALAQWHALRRNNLFDDAKAALDQVVAYRAEIAEELRYRLDTAMARSMRDASNEAGVVEWFIDLLQSDHLPDTRVLQQVSFVAARIGSLEQLERMEAGLNRYSSTPRDSASFDSATQQLKTGKKKARIRLERASGK
ncbi:GSCFA domain-containing protein [Paracoccus sphaerophysae]|uniref:GSCFA domain-containing protein n=1 Tax=Paracoccus sphaerophysae TaxID=690417 RepID=UPI000A5665EB|nr:GSCFA domain-containing protein [Paracoccus sphaerophysae]